MEDQTMKRIYFIAITISVVLSLFSCQKETEQAIPVSVSRFSATIEKPVDAKSYLTSDLKVFWEETDKVNINGCDYDVEPQSDSTTAWLQKMFGPYPQCDPDSTYTAIYPASLYADGQVFLLPHTLKHLKTNKFSNIPMWAKSKNGKFAFKNIFGVLKVSVASSYTVKKISVTSSLNMCGNFIVSNDKAVVAGDEIYKGILLDCGTGVSGGDFYIPIPAGDYSGKNLMVTINKSDLTNERMTTDQNATIQIAPGAIYTFPFFKDGSLRLIETPTIDSLL